MKKMLAGLVAAFFLAAMYPAVADPADGGCLVAVGIGSATLSGSGKVIVEGKGMVKITGEDFRVYANGYGIVQKSGKTSVYKGAGWIRVFGTNMVVEIHTYTPTSAGKACGSGFFVLSGTGAFRKWKR